MNTAYSNFDHSCSFALDSVYKHVINSCHFYLLFIYFLRKVKINEAIQPITSRGFLKKFPINESQYNLIITSRSPNLQFFWRKYIVSLFMSYTSSYLEKKSVLTFEHTISFSFSFFNKEEETMLSSLPRRLSKINFQVDFFVSHWILKSLKFKN